MSRLLELWPINFKIGVDNIEHSVSGDGPQFIVPRLGDASEKEDNEQKEYRKLSKMLQKVGVEFHHSFVHRLPFVYTAFINL